MTDVLKLAKCQIDVYPSCIKNEIIIIAIFLRISMFHCAFFNSIIDKHQHMHFLIQHYISLESGANLGLGRLGSCLGR